MIRISVDRDKCMGHARCNAVAPDLFPLDEDGYVELAEGTIVADQMRIAADAGAAACPERALSVASE